MHRNTGLKLEIFFFEEIGSGSQNNMLKTGMTCWESHLVTDRLQLKTLRISLETLTYGLNDNAFNILASFLGILFSEVYLRSHKRNLEKQNAVLMVNLKKAHLKRAKALNVLFNILDVSGSCDGKCSRIRILWFLQFLSGPLIGKDNEKITLQSAGHTHTILCIWTCKTLKQSRDGRRNFFWGMEPENKSGMQYAVLEQRTFGHTR